MSPYGEIGEAGILKRGPLPQVVGETSRLESCSSSSTRFLYHILEQIRNLRSSRISILYMLTIVYKRMDAHHSKLDKILRRSAIMITAICLRFVTPIGYYRPPTTLPLLNLMLKPQSTFHVFEYRILDFDDFI